MPKFASYAEYCRHHRKVMLLAMELGVTPIEAEARMKAVEVRERHRAKMARRGIRTPLQPIPLIPDQPAAPRFDDFEARWMMRD